MSEHGYTKKKLIVQHLLSYFHLELSSIWNKKRSWSEYFQTIYKAVIFFKK